jgi:hypothetical protein
MRTNTLRRTLIAVCAAASLLAAGGAEAAFRNYISAEIGNDANPCSFALPCRLLPAALAVVDPGGEIWIMDSANYNTGTVNVNKSVTILAIPGVIGSVLATGGDAMIINGASIRVTLRNLVFVNGGGGFYNGVNWVSGTSLTIVESSFSGFTSAGVNIGNVGMKGQIINSLFDRNNVGLRVIGGVVRSLNNNFVNNTIAIETSGAGYTGPSGNATYPPQGPTRVYVTGGSVIDNGTAYHMDSPGNRYSGTCNGSNIFLHNDNGGYHVQQLGNTTNLSVTGPADQNVGCTNPTNTIDQYQSNINQQPNL